MNAAREFRNLAEEEEGGAREIRWRGFRWKESFHSLRIKFQPSLPTKVTIKNLASLLERIKVLFLFFFSLSFKKPDLLIYLFRSIIRIYRLSNCYCYD